MYSELVYFEGAHFSHIVAYVERLRLRQLTLKAAELHKKQRVPSPLPVAPVRRLGR